MANTQPVKEEHYHDRIGWLRAAVLGANDGIVSTASLIVGVAASQADQSIVILSAIAGLVAGAMAMASGEYVSVSSQSDTEQSDLQREKRELEEDYDFEVVELATIYEHRGLNKTLAHEVAIQLMDHDALGAHARDELGITDMTKAQPLQAAFASAASFVAGAALPVLVLFLSPFEFVIESVLLSTLLFLALLGGMAAKTGGSNVLKGILRVTFWGLAAMGATILVGYLFGVTA